MALQPNRLYVVVTTDDGSNLVFTDAQAVHAVSQDVETLSGALSWLSNVTFPAGDNASPEGLGRALKEHTARAQEVLAQNEG